MIDPVVTFKTIVKDFAKKYEDNGESLISDNNFEELIKTHDMNEILEKDIPTFENGIKLGLEAGFRMGLIHVLFLGNNLNKEAKELDNEDAEVTTIPPDEINYI